MDWVQSKNRARIFKNAPDAHLLSYRAETSCVCGVNRHKFENLEKNEESYWMRLLFKLNPIKYPLLRRSKAQHFLMLQSIHKYLRENLEGLTYQNLINFDQIHIKF